MNYKKNEIRKILVGLVEHFAFEEDGEYWGFDTNLGNCYELFDQYTNKIIEFIKEKQWTIY